MLEANWLGQIRTGAASGYATGLLAAPGPAVIAVIGSGFQARSQLDAVLAVRPASAIRVWSRSPEKRAAFAAEPWPVPVKAVDTAQAAVDGAGIVITATNAKDPVIDDAWITPGVHINAMGSNQADRRELPSALVRRSRIIVDSVEQAQIESGDLLLALGHNDWNGVEELKDVVAGHDPRAVTIFKSNGLGVEDVAAAGYVYERALAEKRGTAIPASGSVDPYRATR
jgi:ornithine cyclodeaminase/alanine dehydrogenase-like protein (mu-crystallin family)